jgi:hypothetical protein
MRARREDTHTRAAGEGKKKNFCSLGKGVKRPEKRAARLHCPCPATRYKEGKQRGVVSRPLDHVQRRLLLRGGTALEAAMEEVTTKRKRTGAYRKG